MRRQMSLNPRVEMRTPDSWQILWIPAGFPVDEKREYLCLYLEPK